jgi:hypothetical protein
MKTYAGIGSRAIPPEELPFIQYLADALRRDGYVLRSGHATGVDQAFEAGAGAAAEVYLPWPKYEQGVAMSAGYVKGEPSGAALIESSNHHPEWEACNKATRMLHARNAHIILGRHLDTPVKFVICWTPNAAAIGGTAQAIRIARAHGITVFNLADPATRERLERFESKAAEVPSDEAA